MRKGTLEAILAIALIASLSFNFIQYLAVDDRDETIMNMTTDIRNLKQNIHVFESYYGAPIHDVRRVYTKQDLRFLVNHKLLQTPMKIDPAEYETVKSMLLKDLDMDDFLKQTAYKFQKTSEKTFYADSYEVMLLISIPK